MTKAKKKGPKTERGKRAAASRAKRPKTTTATGPKGINWSIPRERYVTTVDKISYAEIAESLGVNPSTVERRAAEEQWKEQRQDHFTEVARHWRELCKNEIGAVKLESLRAIRATKTVLLRQLSRGLMRNASVGDLIALVRQEMVLLGEPDVTANLNQSVDEDKLREVLKQALDTGKIDRTALRKSAKNV